MTRDRIIEVGLTITIGLMAWLLHQTYDLNGKVSALDSNMSEAKDRMNRITTAIPSIAEKVAQQDVHTPATAVVVATKPVQDSAHNWASTVLVYDVGKAAVTRFSLPLNGEFDRGAYAKVTGAAMATERNALSFKDLETDLRNVQDTTQMAEAIVANSSFILRSATADQYMATFRALHGTDSARVQKRTMSAANMTWQNINDDLARHPNQFRPTADSIPSTRDRRY